MVQTPNGDAVDTMVSDAASSASNDENNVPSTPPSREIQLNILKTSFISRLVIDSTVYLLPVKWFLGFIAWAKGETGQEPGPVDPLAMLCDEYGVLSENAIEDRDWHITNEEGWNLIKRW